MRTLVPAVALRAVTIGTRAAIGARSTRTPVSTGAIGTPSAIVTRTTLSWASITAITTRTTPVVVALVTLGELLGDGLEGLVRGDDFDESGLLAGARGRQHRED
ncbi:unannotated protein [freshwater metagenome]|uniref:Unannotated protein n=1 Tax=freshwater metagenome TaxID=449393 RepID=A0A6J6RK40_9ZZZZ